MSLVFFGVLMFLCGGGGLYVAQKRGYNGFYLGYTLYARTILGKYIHRHSLKNAQQTLTTSSHMRFETPSRIIRIVPFLKDNFAYLIICKQTLQAIAIDPADAQKMLLALEAETKVLGPNLRLTTIACTHYHRDHAGGNLELNQALGGQLTIIGGKEERSPGVEACTKSVVDLHEFDVGALRFQVRETPAHTLGHVCFLLFKSRVEEEEECLFTGDFLFSAGCGRFFEGSAEQFCESMFRLNLGLSPQTEIYCGHEYTLSNLKFACMIQPDNKVLQEYTVWTEHELKAQRHSIPSTLEREEKINLFLQASNPAMLTIELIRRVREVVLKAGSVEVSGGLDRFESQKRFVVVDDVADKDVVTEKNCEQVVRALRALKDRF